MRTRAIIHVQQLEKNYQAIKNHLSASTQIMPVIKADAYGHQASLIAQHLDQLKPVAFGVAELNEALELSQLNLSTPCFNFGYCEAKLLAEAIEHQVIVSLFQLEDIAMFAELNQNQKQALKLHLKIDTGMNRLGLKPHAWQQAFEQIEKHGLSKCIKGIYTHLSDSDQLDPLHSKAQIMVFKQAIDFFSNHLKRPLISHCASSSPMQHLGAQIHEFNWVRPGIALYGYPYLKTPSIKPILEWRASLVQIKKIQAQETVGYNQCFKAQKNMTIGVVSVGYGDGFYKNYHKHPVYYQNMPCKILGNICMDLMMIDLSSIHEPVLYDEVSLISAQKDNDAYHLASQTNQSLYEILTSIGKRVVREVKFSV